jgi:hypothetical protein
MPMRLDLLLKREDFVQTFEQSFAKYLSDVFGVVAIVNWKGNSKSNTSLLANYKLNVIYSKNINRIKLRSIVSEYAYHPNALRRFLQETYIQLAVCTYFEWFFVKTRVKVNPWISDLNGLCIIPGNHSIRIIDLEASSCRVILKEGFNAQFIKNEICLREKYKFLPTPKLLNVDSEGLWYEEVQVSALPLNRISDRNIKEKALLEAHRDLVNLYGLTLERVNANNYFKSLNKSCYDLVDRLPSVYDQEEKNRIKFVLRRLMANIDANSVYRVELVQSHGDFQPANILISNSSQQLYLIDWEYTAKRSVYYDALVFSTKCRSPKGLARRVELVMHETDISWKWCVENANAKLSKLDLIVFLIEDLMVRLLELQIPDMINKDSGLEIWSNEVKKMDWLTYG